MELTLKKEFITSKTAARIFCMTAFTIATALGAFVRIPLSFTPVPLTLQTFFVLLAGAVLGSRRGMSSMLGYIFLGACGLPIFTNAAAGFASLIGPTGGYLVGFVAAAFLTGTLIRRVGNSFLATLAVFLIADTVILSCGTLGLRIFLGIPAGQAFVLGFVPFVAVDTLKAVAAAAVYRALAKRVAEIL